MIEKSRKVSSAAQYLTFVASTGSTDENIEIRYEEENIWLSQKLIAELYGVSVKTVNEHLRNIFSDGELSENTVVRNFRITATDGKNYS
ncbi:MAG: hypothetical protein FWE07_09190 [Turicibacter sp.]|nr:hypothetical protein [Turicibacter sp.]